MTEIIRRKIPEVILGIIGTLLILEYFIDVTVLTAFKNEITVWSMIIYNFAAILGALVVMRHHGNRIMKSKEVTEKYLSLVVPISFIAFIAVALLFGATSDLYVDLYTKTLVPIGSCFWGITLFYSFWGAYKTFRINNLDGLALFIFGVIYFLYMTPIVAATFPFIVTLGKLEGYAIGRIGRPLYVCSALAAIVVGVRSILGKEKSALE
jgi:hypothetical protein